MANLVCPHCGDFTSLRPEEFEAKVLLRAGLFGEQFQYHDGVATAMTMDEPGQLTYAITVCLSCGKRFVAIKIQHGDWRAVFPIPRRTVAADIPEPIKSEFEEACLCFSVGAYRACVTMCQIALEATWQKHSKSGLQQLKEEGIISPRLYDKANEVRLWANLTKHQPIPESVTQEEAEELLNYLDELLDTIYVQDKRLAGLTQKRKQIEKKATKKTKPKPPPIVH